MTPELLSPPRPPAPEAPPPPHPAPPHTARASRSASLLATADDEAATSRLPGFFAGTLGAAPLALGIVEGIASAARRRAPGRRAALGGPRRRRLISVGDRMPSLGCASRPVASSVAWVIRSLGFGELAWSGTGGQSGLVDGG